MSVSETSLPPTPTKVVEEGGEALRSRRRRVRVFYAASAGDVIESYRHWREGADDPSQFSVTYASQFFDACRQLDLEALVISSNRASRSHRDGPFRLVNRPILWEDRRGVLYHLGELWNDLRLIASAIWFRADVALLHGGFNHWYLFSVLRPFGIKLVPLLFVVFWQKHRPPGRAKRWLRRPNGWFFRKQTSAILSMSDDITKQVLDLTGGRPAPIRPFLPMFRPEQFIEVPPPPAAPPFRVLFAGRIERYKGVFELLDVARRFAREGRTDIEFDLCGTGPALDELNAQAKDAGVTGRFRIHGHCDRPTMQTMYARSHVVVVPTTSEFVEGFNQVVVEGVLSGRPVVTSSVCPALEYVREAVVEVPPDDVSAYGDAILRLADHPEFYEEKRAACPGVRDRVLDPGHTFGAVLERALREVVEPGQSPR